MGKEKAQNSIFKKVMPIAMRIAVLVAVMFLLSYVGTILTETQNFFRETAGSTALTKFDKSLEKANELADKQYENLYEIAEKLQYAQSKKEVVDELSQYNGSSDFGLLRFYSQGKSYDVTGGEMQREPYGHEEISALAQTNKQGCTPLYDDGNQGECMAFFVPVRGSAYVDGVLSIMKVHVWAENNVNQNIPIVDAKTILENDDLLAAFVIDEHGTAYAASTSQALDASLGNNIYKFINNFSTDAAARIGMQNAVDANEKSYCNVESTDGDYVFTVAPIESLGGNLYLVTMVEREGLILTEMEYVRYIINLTVIAIIALIVGGIYVFFYYRDSKHALEAASNLDPVVGCPNADRFRMLADKALKEHADRSFAVAIYEIRQFQYLQETLPQGEIANVLKYVSKVLDTFCNAREHYGYLGDGKFVLFLLYSGEKTIRDRSHLIETVLSKSVELGSTGKTKKRFNIGVGVFEENGKLTAQELLNRANMALQTAKTNVHLPFVVYNEEVNARRENNAKIELEMDSALANNEFRLFLQPKYNVAADKIDSAEALVRWFDPKKGEYRYPDEFISLFESNGFIVKLDHFMYIEVLKYMQAALSRGEKQVPISVNVSLVTATENDFLPYYIENKKKYGIPDGFITIEFTEGFLMEDHQKLREMVERLHRNGIRCSLDDFGTGYASFSVLKDVPFDELKIDATLLGANFDKKEETMVVETIVRLGKSLGMRIVQEGVEQKAVFERLIESGVEVIQGYYYAKAIPLEEYKLFLGSNTSIKYKSLVK